MKKLAYLTHVYNAQPSLQEQVDAWAGLSHRDTESLEFLIVDDCSDPPLTLRRYNLPLRLFRITTDIPWNMAGAKNLLHVKSSAEWLLFSDVDNRVRPEDLAMLAQNTDNLDPGEVYMFPWFIQGERFWRPHPNTFLIHRGSLERVGGFDEDFCGNYGYEDIFFHTLSERAGLARVLLEDVPFHDDGGSTTGLVRDIAHNRDIMNAKCADPDYRTGDRLRFNWVEIPDL